MRKAKRKIEPRKASDYKLVKIDDKTTIEVRNDIPDEEARTNYLNRLRENTIKY